MRTFREAWDAVSKARAQQVHIKPTGLLSTDGRAVAEVSTEIPIPYTVVVDSRYLRYAVSAIPEPKSFEVKDNHLIIRDGRRTMGIPMMVDSEVYQLPKMGDGDAEYPGLDFTTMRHAVMFSNKDLKSSRKKTETSDAQTGDVILEAIAFRDQSVYATNRYIAYEGPSGMDADRDMIVPLEAARDFSPMFAGATSTVRFDGRNFSMSGGDTSALVPIIDKKFPNVGRIIREPQDGIVIEGAPLVDLKDSITSLHKLDRNQYVGLVVSSDRITVKSTAKVEMPFMDRMEFSSEKSATVNFYVEYLYVMLMFCDRFVLNTDFRRPSYGDSDYGERMMIMPQVNPT